ncbi:MAG: hypothetical protein GY828_04530, partial [Candidatus Gracilibacteria bacterium]|nr:hypothetical protein [Candidatus Gracilibacteria bacterium]
MNNSLLITSVLNEVKSPLRDKDYDLATRLLIDVITDSELDSRFLQKAIQLRADQMVFSQDGGSENFHQLENELWKLIEDIEEIVSPNRGRSIDQII